MKTKKYRDLRRIYRW